MSHRFVFAVAPSGTEIQLVGPSGPVPVDLWALEAPQALLPGIDLVRRLVAADAALAEGDTALVEHRAVAGLSTRETASLGLPPLAEAVLRLEGKGLVVRPDYRVELSWQRPTGQPIVGGARIGAFLRIGQDWRRLPDALFQIAEAADRLNGAAAEPGEKLAAIAALREVLPAGAEAGLTETKGLVGHVTISVADAFSVDLSGEGQMAKLVPVLHRAGGDPEAPLLPPDQQRSFGEQQFNSFSEVRSVYALGASHYVVLQPTLQRALGAVRRLHGAPLATKRAFLANPRAFLREALPEADDVLLERVFRETAAYSDRVLGLGLWTPRVLPWIKLQPTDWIERGSEGGSGSARPASSGGIDVGGRQIPLDVDAAGRLRNEIELAMAAERPAVSVAVDGDTVAVPANAETLAAVDAFLRTAKPTRMAEGGEPTAPEVLIIRPNEEEVDAEGGFVDARPAPPLGPPRCVATALKPHQTEGLIWLQRAWSSGRPGVLLADDMGLGKTLQTLAFLAWLREGMAAGTLTRAPILVVAPTGLLENWRAEHDLHLAAPGLGRCTEAFGRRLAELKRPSADGRPGIDPERLERADWVLTTYETLRDYDRDFGQVRFAVLLFDEAQKVKTPAVRVTDAAKAMNAEFRIALTGTPVENRLSDLWCITDTVHPAFLGDLKTFSQRYEREPDPERLKALRSALDSGYGGKPPLMLRRLKRDRLPDLPVPEERPTEIEMPPPQRHAYEAALAAAREVSAPQAVLQALQSLRAISLHPLRNGEDGEATTDEAFIAASARLQGAVAVLDRVHAAGEKALVFLDDLKLQARLAGLLQRRYRLPAPPTIISGEVAGKVRQTRVDRFQAEAAGFDVMILSPRAGGVGLTLTRANHAVHLSRWWNPAVEDQCNGRILRIGQTRPVFIYLPMAVLPGGRRSFDQNLQALLERKRQLMREALMPTEATVGDRDELFRATVS